MGGVDGFGAVLAETDEPVFHAAWERRAFALTLAMARPGGWTLDMSRFARENRPPSDYLGRSYYQIWLAGLEQLMLERGLISGAEIAAGRSLQPAKPGLQVLAAASVTAVLQKGGACLRQIDSPPRFAVGQTVQARNDHPLGHTRLPRYVRGRSGEIERLHGAHVFPDSNAHGQGEAPQWLYTVRFAARALWGNRAEPGVTVSVDAWESYLEPLP